jgi:hypothetical protein
LFLGPEPLDDSILGYYKGPQNGFTTFPIDFTTSSDAIIGVFPTEAPVVPTSFPSGAPSAPSISAAPSGTDVEVTVVITFDQYAFETGYRIETSLGFVAHEVLPGVLGAISSIEISETITLSSGADYVFFITDSFGDGFNGRATVYLGDTPMEDRVLAYHGPNAPNFNFQKAFPFIPSEEGILDVIIPGPTILLPLSLVFNFPDSVGWDLETDEFVIASRSPFDSNTGVVQVEVDFLEPLEFVTLFIYSSSFDSGTPLSGSYTVTAGNQTLAAGDQGFGAIHTHLFIVGGTGTVPISMFIKSSPLINTIVGLQLTKVNFFEFDEVIGDHSIFIDNGASLAVSTMVEEDRLYNLEIFADAEAVESQHLAIGSADPFEGRMLVSADIDYSFVAKSIYEKPVAEDATRTLRLEINFGFDPSSIGWALYMDEEQSSPISESRQSEDALNGLEFYTFGPDKEYTYSMAFMAHEEEIPLPPIGDNRFRDFTLVVFSSLGDGLLPGGEYKVYDGDSLIALGSIVGGYGDTHVFSLAGETVLTTVPSMAPSTAEMPSLSPSAVKEVTMPPSAGNTTDEVSLPPSSSNVTKETPSPPTSSGWSCFVPSIPMMAILSVSSVSLFVI